MNVMYQLLFSLVMRGKGKCKEIRKWDKWKGNGVYKLNFKKRNEK